MPTGGLLQCQTVNPINTPNGEVILNIGIPIQYSTMYSIIKGGFTAGNNTVTVPNHPDTVSVIIIVPDIAEPTNFITLKNTGTDLGFNLSVQYPTILPCRTGSFVINCTSGYDTLQIIFL